MGESVFSKYMTRPAGYLMFFFCGILAGVAVVQVQNSAALAGIFSEYFLNQYANLRIDSGKLLSYVGRYRCGQYFLAVCCGCCLWLRQFLRAWYFCWEWPGERLSVFLPSVWAWREF